MVDRTDLDALLIGALYGELTPAEEARLTAHLESHPADRTALDNLTRTRAAVRDSRILAFQLEPPQAISALLLQEASRRAPRAPTVDRSETASWFQRFVRSFAAHPAMAAAATLVLVVGVAGTLYLSGTNQFARSEAPPAETERAAATAATTPAMAPGAGAPGAGAAAVSAPDPEAAGAPRADQAPGGSTGAGSSSGFVAGSAPSPAGPAMSDETAAAQGATADHQAAAVVAGDKPEQRDERDEREGAYAHAAYDKKAKGKATGRDAALQKLGALEEPQAKTIKPEPVRGIELRSPQLMPKDFKDSDDEKVAGRRERAADGRTASDLARNQRGAAAIGGGAPASPPSSAAPSPAPAAPPPAAPRAAGPAAAADFDLAPDQASQANEAKRPPAKPSVNRPPPPPAAVTAPNAQNTVSAQNTQNDRRIDKTANATNADANKQAQADARSARDRTLLEWARKQHEQVIALVGANRCRDAASAAVEIYNRAPDYYNANIATDRQIKPCLAYVNDQRERVERSRAAKNANDAQAPAQAAPSRN